LTRKLALACAVAGLASVAALAGTGQARTQGRQPWVVNGGSTVYVGGDGGIDVFPAPRG
jgi:hypothetical protein